MQIKRAGKPITAMGISVIMALIATACGGGGFDLAKYCDRQVAVEAVMDDLGDTSEDLDAAIDSLKDLKDLAPDELKQDYTDLLTVFETIKDATGQAEDVSETDPAEAMRIMIDVFSDLEAGGLETAGAKIEDYGATNC